MRSSDVGNTKRTAEESGSQRMTESEEREPK